MNQEFTYEPVADNIDYDFAAVKRYYQPDPLFRVNADSISLLLPNGNIAGISKTDDALALFGDDVEQDRETLVGIFQLHDRRHELLLPYSNDELAALLTAYRGLPLLLDPSPQHTLYRAVIHQQISMAAAHTVTERLVQRFGANKQGYCGFPGSEKLAALSVEDYRGVGLSRFKAETMLRLSRAMCEKELVFPAAVREPEEYRNLREMLLPFKGIGEWSVQCVALFGYAYPHLIPTADLGLQEALRAWYGLAERPSRQWMRLWAEKHRQAGSYLTFYLWQWRRSLTAFQDSLALQIGEQKPSLIS